MIRPATWMSRGGTHQAQLIDNSSIVTVKRPDASSSSLRDGHGALRGHDLRVEDGKLALDRADRHGQRWQWPPGFGEWA